MTAHDPDGFDPQILNALHIPVERLRTIVRQLAPAYHRRTTIPVLETALIEAGPDGAVFRQTDLDLQITVTAEDLICATPFRTCVSLGLLRRFASSFDGIIRLSYQPGSTVKAGIVGFPRITLATDDGVSATINALYPAEDFPLFMGKADHEADQGNHWRPMVCSAKEFRRHIDLARHCISTEEARYYLNGIFVHAKPGTGTLRSIATDGHRLAIIDGAIPAIEGLNAILPRPFVQAVAGLIDPKANETVHLAFHATSPRVRAICGAIQIDSKLIDGTFPDYTRVIPSAATRLSMALSETGLRRLRPFATQRSNVVSFKDGKATMILIDAGGEISIPVTMTAVEGEAADMTRTTPELGVQTFGFNLEYLIAQARVTPTFRVEVGSPSDPARIYGEDPDAMWVLVPMRM